MSRPCKPTTTRRQQITTKCRPTATRMELRSLQKAALRSACSRLCPGGSRVLTSRHAYVPHCTRLTTAVSAFCSAMGLAHSTISLLDYVWPRIGGPLDHVSDDEYLWEPVPRCWSVRLQGDVWEVERNIPPPEPPPVTTFAWRTWHIGSECDASAPNCRRTLLRACTEAIATEVSPNPVVVRAAASYLHLVLP
jgi:hypothetical protein